MNDLNVNEHRQRSAAEMVEIPVAEAIDLGTKVLAQVGYGPENAKVVIDHMIDGVWSGYPHTGISRILSILDDPRAHESRRPPEILRESASTAVIDAGNTIGYIAALDACDCAIAKAKATGVSAVTLFDTYFSGRNAYYLDRIVRQSLVGIHAASTPPRVAPFGGRQPALGVNPIGFGFPRKPHPLICDFGTASFMWGEILLHKQMGRQLPEGVAVNADGDPTTDPAAAMKGAILPFGGHKGSALNLAVQLLCALAFQDSAEHPWEGSGFVFIVIDPERFTDAAVYEANVEKIANWVESIAPRPGMEVRLPSARGNSLKAENAAKATVPCEIHIYRKLKVLASERPTVL